MRSGRAVRRRMTLPVTCNAAVTCNGPPLRVSRDMSCPEKIRALLRYAHELERYHSLRITARDFATDQAGPHLEVVTASTTSG
jgi:hypothetical protein